VTIRSGGCLQSGELTSFDVESDSEQDNSLVMAGTVGSRFWLHRDKIDNKGVVTLRHNSRLHDIGLGRKLIGGTQKPH
jgi:hypothetical protein